MDKVRTIEVRDQFGVESLTKTIMRNQLSWFCNVKVKKDQQAKIIWTTGTTQR